MTKWVTDASFLATKVSLSVPISIWYVLMDMYM